MNSPNPSSEQRESRLVSTFVKVADTLVDDYDIADVLHQLTGRCAELLGADAAGLLLSDQRGHLRVMASSTEQTQLLELFQLQTNEGPCLDCFRTGEMVVAEDLTAVSQRWPTFVAHALAAGFASVHALPMRLRNEIIGTLNLFTSQPGPLSAQDIEVAQALADTATIGILQERALRRGELLTEQLQTALNGRIIIEQAKGIIAYAGDRDMGQSFQLLRSYANSHTIPLTEVARRLVDGQFPAEQVLRQPASGAWAG